MPNTSATMNDRVSATLAIRVTSSLVWALIMGRQLRASRLLRHAGHVEKPGSSRHIGTMSELPGEFFASAQGLTKGDFVLPFDIARAGVRGRLVRLDLASARALAAHALPEAANRIAGETLALSAILGTSLKLDGRLTVQTKSDGPLDLVTADYFGARDGAPIGIRGYARVDEARLADLDTPVQFDTLAGDGVMAITIEPRREGKTYQGIVELSPAGIATSAETYFAQSEQLPTVVRLAAAPVFTPGTAAPAWRVGGIMLQATPDGRGPEDDWERLASFLETVEDIELVDLDLPAEKL